MGCIRQTVLRLSACLATLLAGWAALSPELATAADGQLELRVTDGEGGPAVPCRVHLKNVAGKPFKPKKAIYWNDHFVLPGTMTMVLPLGVYQFEIERGPEYPVYTGHFQINNFADDNKTLVIKRHVDMAANGWWSGDLEVHRSPKDIELLMAAEDLHMAQVITWWNAKSDWGDKPWPKELLHCADGNRCYSLLAGGHARAGGTFLFFNQPAPLLLHDTDPEYPSPLEFIRQARRAPDAWIDLTRPYWWDLPTLVALQQIDSIQIANGQMARDRTAAAEPEGKPRDVHRYPDPGGVGPWSQDIYFHLLNCGLRIPPSAGSASGLSPNPVGYNRMYVHIDGSTFSAEKWWQGFRAGQVTVTNGPLLQPSVQGHPPGYILQAEEGQSLEVEIDLTFSLREPVTYLEIIKDGHVEHSVRFEEYSTSGKLPKLTFKQSGWFLVRAVTDQRKTYRFAMTAPYYVQIGYKPRISKQSAQFFLDWLVDRAKQIKITDAVRREGVMQYHRKARDFWQDILARANAE